MNKKIDIEKLDKRTPFSVPEDYFTTLTHKIMEKVDKKDTVSFLRIFHIRALAPAIVIIAIIFSGVWYNNQNLQITENDLVELLSFYQVEDELILEFIELELEENIEEYLLNEFNYNEIIYEL
tara:strand:+ start:380 stop:748 length:369 start_codon:yes stop_codon:yes gene_type:complete